MVSNVGLGPLWKINPELKRTFRLMRKHAVSSALKMRLFEWMCCMFTTQISCFCRGFSASIIGVLGCTTWIHLSICGFRLWNHLQVAYCTAKLLAASHWVGWPLRWPLVWFLVSPLPRWPMGFMQGRQLELGFFPVHSTRVTRSIPSIPILKQTHGESPFIFSLRKCFQLNFSRLTQHMHLTCV